MTLTLIQPASTRMRWTTVRCHSLLSSVAAVSVFPIFCQTFLIMLLLQLVLGRPGPILDYGTFQYKSDCVTCWWSAHSICQATWGSLHSLSMFYALCCPVLTRTSSFAVLFWFFAICDELRSVFLWLSGVAVVRWCRSTKLTYVRPGYYWDEWPCPGSFPGAGHFISVCNQPPRSTQPGYPFVRSNEYQPKGSDALRLDWLIDWLIE